MPSLSPTRNRNRGSDSRPRSRTGRSVWSRLLNLIKSFKITWKEPPRGRSGSGHGSTSGRSANRPQRRSESDNHRVSSNSRHVDSGYDHTPGHRRNQHRPDSRTRDHYRSHSRGYHNGSYYPPRVTSTYRSRSPREHGRRRGGSGRRH